MNKKTRLKASRAADYIFLVLYIILILATILDMCGISLPFLSKITTNSTVLMKFIIIVFASVGIVVLNDKRELQQSIEKPLERIEESIDSYPKGTGVHLFTNKDDFYLYFTQVIRDLPSGAEILVTAFEKNQTIDYYTGENKHIEAFMDDWTTKVTSNSVSVRHIVHVFTKKEFTELEERIEQFRNCINYSAGVMIGFPIRPFIDFTVVNKEIVMISFSNDKTAPYEEAFTLVIVDSKIASNFEKYFNLYWNTDCLIVKSRDGIHQSNLKEVGKLASKDMPRGEPYELNRQSLEVFNISEHFSSFKPLVNDLFSLLLSGALNYPCDIARQKLTSFSQEIHSICTDPILVPVTDVYNVMSKILQNAHHQIEATSVEIGDNTFWTSKNGESIFSLNTKGISEKGITVKRIFIILPDQQKALSAVFSKQFNAGVGVSVIAVEASHKEAYKDFVIIDDTLAMEVFYSGEAKLYLGEETIKSFSSAFSSYLAQATTITNKMGGFTDEN